MTKKPRSQTWSEVDKDQKGPYVLQSEVEKAIKEMRDKKAKGDDDDVPVVVLKLQWLLRRSQKLQNAATITQSA